MCVSRWRIEEGGAAVEPDHVGHLQVAPLARDVQRALPVHVDGVHVDAQGDKRLGDGQAAPKGGEVEEVLAAAVGFVEEARVGGDELADLAGVLAPGGVVELLAHGALVEGLLVGEEVDLGGLAGLALAAELAGLGLAPAVVGGGVRVGLPEVVLVVVVLLGAAGVRWVVHDDVAVGVAEAEV
jgi:hypothetical protein